MTTVVTANTKNTIKCEVDFIRDDLLRTCNRDEVQYPFVRCYEHQLSSVKYVGTGLLTIPEEHIEQ